MLVLLLTSLWTASTVSLSILWQDDTAAVREGMSVYVKAESGELAPVGTVESITPSDAGMLMLFSYDRQSQAILRKGALASLEKVTGEEGRAIVLVNAVPDAAPVAEGDVLYGSVPLSSALSPGISAERLVTDWKLTAVLLIGVVVFIVLLAHFTKLVFRMVAFLLCIGGGAGGAVFLPEYVHTGLTKFVSSSVAERIHLDVIAYVVAFLLGYVAVLILVMIILSPLRAKKTKAK